MSTRASNAAAAWLSRHADFRAALDADQTEFRAVLTGAINIDEGLRDERRTGELELEMEGERLSWIEAQEIEESRCGAIAEEIDRRAMLLKDSYPFTRRGNRLVYQESPTRVYEFCLAVTLAPTLSEGSLAKLPVAFEFLARDVLMLYAGQSAQGLRTGWPRHKADKLPARAKRLFALVNDQTGEWLWDPQLGKPEDPNPRDVKDLGLDVLVWKAMPDGRCGQLFLLGQCACGTSGWDSKWRDLDLGEIKTWFRPSTVSAPVRCFFVPFHIGNTEMLDEVSAKAGLTWDRARIAVTAQRNVKFIASRALEPYDRWVKLVASTMVASRRRGRLSSVRVS